MTNSPGKAHGRPGKMLLSPEEMAVLPQAWEAAWSSEEKKPVVKVKMGVPFPPLPPRLSVKEHHAREGFLLGKWVAGSLGQFCLLHLCHQVRANTTKYRGCNHIPIIFPYLRCVQGAGEISDNDLAAFSTSTKREDGYR